MDEATGNRQRATVDEPEMQNAKCEMQNEGSGIKDQGSGNVAAHSVRHRAPSVGAVIGRPPESPACRGGSYPEGEPPARPDEATGNRQRATGDEDVGAVIGRLPEAEASDEASGIRHQASGNENVGAVIGRPPEDEASGIAEKAKKRIAGLEGLRRWMLILAPLLLIGGYATDILPILYAAAIPLAIALLVTYLIKWAEENTGKEEAKSKKQKKE